MKETLTKYYCDTCGGDVTFIEPNKPEIWGRVAIKMNQAWVVGDDSAWGDMCPNCLQSFNSWMIDRKREQREL